MECIYSVIAVNCRCGNIFITAAYSIMRRLFLFLTFVLHGTLSFSISAVGQETTEKIYYYYNFDIWNERVDWLLPPQVPDYHIALSKQHVHRVTVQYYHTTRGIDSLRGPNRVCVFELDTNGKLTYYKEKNLGDEIEDFYSYEYDKKNGIAKRIHDRKVNRVRGNLREFDSAEVERRSYIYEDGRLLKVVTESDSTEYSSQITYKYTSNGTIETIEFEYDDRIIKFAFNAFQHIDNISSAKRFFLGLLTQDDVAIAYYTYNSNENLICECDSHRKNEKPIDIQMLLPDFYKDTQYIYDTNQRVTDIVVRSSVATPGEYHCICNPAHEHDNSQILFSFQIKYNDRGLPISSFSKDGGRGVLLYKYEYYDE